jgi:hypothetical protein
MDNPGISRVRPGDLAETPGGGSRDAELDSLRAEIQSLSAEIMAMKSRIGDYSGHSLNQGSRRDSSLKEALGGAIQTPSDGIALMEQDISMADGCCDQPIQPPVGIRVGNATCPSCGALNDMWAKNCVSCGADSKTGAAAYNVKTGYQPEPDGICPFCGANLYEEAIFCYTCGARVQI